MEQHVKREVNLRTHALEFDPPDAAADRIHPGRGTPGRQGRGATEEDGGSVHFRRGSPLVKGLAGDRGRLVADALSNLL